MTEEKGKLTELDRALAQPPIGGDKIFGASIGGISG